ncbi:MAG: hypothetical protein WEB51_06925 [Mycobacterium sp.]
MTPSADKILAGDHPQKLIAKGSTTKHRLDCDSREPGDRQVNRERSDLVSRGYDWGPTISWTPQ